MMKQMENERSEESEYTAAVHKAPDFKKSISGPIELKLSGKTLYAIL